MKILFIGNSYTYYNELPSLFEKICGENGQSAEVYSVTSGGRYLRQNLDTEDACTLKLRNLVENHHFDICVLQEQSTYPLRDRESFLRDILRVAEYMTPHTDRFALYATWGRQFGAKFLEDLGITCETMAKILYEAYQEAQQRITSSTGMPVDVSPVGLTFASVNRNPDIDLYNPDLSHPSYEGSCLSAMVHYKTIFGHAPDSVGCLGLKPEISEYYFQAL